MPGQDWFVSQPSVKVFRQSKSGGVTVPRIFLEALETNRGNVAIDFRVYRSWFRRIRFQEQPDGFIGRFANKGRPTREQVIEYRAETVNICRLCHPRASTSR